jgi:hypothetical protein
VWIRRIPSRHADTVSGGPGLRYGDVAALRHRLAGESLAFANAAKDPAERFIRLWESYCYEPDRKVAALIKAHEAVCVKAIAAGTDSFGDASRMRAFERFVNMLVRGSWMPAGSPVKKAVDARRKPTKPAAPNLRDL